jgi:hypothetical protein
VLHKFSSTQSNIGLSFDFEPDFAAGNLRALSNFPVGLCLREKKVFRRGGGAIAKIKTPNCLRRDSEALLQSRSGVLCVGIGREMDLLRPTPYRTTRAL